MNPDIIYNFKYISMSSGISVFNLLHSSLSPLLFDCTIDRGQNDTKKPPGLQSQRKNSASQITQVREPKTSNKRIPETNYCLISGEVCNRAIEHTLFGFRQKLIASSKSFRFCRHQCPQSLLFSSWPLTPEAYTFRDTRKL